MVEVSPDVINSAKDWLAKKSDTWTSGVCLGDVWSLDGDSIYHTHTVCHAWVSSAYTKYCTGRAGWDAPFKKDAKNILILSCYNPKRTKNNCSSAASDFLVKWMATESPFSQFVLNRDDEESLTKGGVILLLGPDGLNVSEAMWFLKVLRFTTEGAGAAEVFMELVQNGVDGMLAIYVSSFVRTVKGATFQFTGLEGHSTVINDRETDLVGMIQRKINPKANSTYNVFKSDARTIKKVDPKILVQPRARIAGFCKPMKKSDGWGGTVEASGSTKNDFIDQTLAWQKTIQDGLCRDPDIQIIPDSSTIYLDGDL